MDKQTAFELDDAYNAVDKARAWEWLANPETPGTGGFMWCINPMMNKIMSFMTVTHSGGSMCHVMRHMECIAKEGWDSYLRRVLNAND